MALCIGRSGADDSFAARRSRPVVSASVPAKHSLPALSLPLFALLLAGGGCNIVGAVAAKTIPQTEPPKYVGLQGQTAAVMVWADRAVRIDWERIQLDTSAAIQGALQARAKSKNSEIAGVQFPLQPASVVRFQRDRPHLETAPVTEFAPDLGVSRLIYVELEQFSTRSDFSAQMFRGTAVATLKVIEIDPQTREARVAYEENGVRVGFPEKGREEGEVAGNDAVFYGGTIRALAEAVADKFVTTEVN